MPLPDPLHYYPLNESTGTAASVDTGTSPVNLTVIEGTPTVTVGPDGGDARMFGYSPDASVSQAADEASLVFGDGYDWTVNFWCKHNAFSLSPGVENKFFDRDPLIYFSVFPGGGNPIALKVFGSDSNDHGAIASVYGLGDNNWHMITGRFQESTNTWSLYADGAFIGEFTPSTYTPRTGLASDRLILGRAALAIGHVAIFRSNSGDGGFLSASEITELYNAGDGNYWDGSAWSGASLTPVDQAASMLFF